MSISVILTFNSINYDISNYVKKDSIELDTYLFSQDNLKPNTNSVKLVLNRACPYIDALFEWDGDVEIVISNDGVMAFTGYLTNTHELPISCYGRGDVTLNGEDPGIHLLKQDWISADGLVTNFSGMKVCDPSDTDNSFVHVLAALAGVTLASTLPTVSNLVYFSVQDKDNKQYWDVLQDVLYDFMYTFYFDASGALNLFSFNDLQGDAEHVVRTDATVLQESVGKTAVNVKKRLIQYKKVVVNFNEGETIASVTVYRDTTDSDGVTDCCIPIEAGAYYPDTCDADTYAYIDYFLEDGRDILSVKSIVANFSVDSGIEYELENIGTSARIRFHNTSALTRYIRKLQITGTNVVAITADSKVTSTETGGKKFGYNSKYLTSKTDAANLANLLRYFYANSGATYTFRAHHGVLYPSTTLYPSTSLVPLGEIIELGDRVRLYDPLWTGLDVTVAISRKKWVLGKDGATFEAIGIGTITLSSVTTYIPTTSTKSTAQTYKSTRYLSSLSDTADFVGQYGIYNSQRYRCSALPATWELDDAGQTETDVAALIPIHTPGYLGLHYDAAPEDAKNGDWYLRVSKTSGDANRGVFVYDGSVWTRTIRAAYLYAALADIVYICAVLSDDGTSYPYGSVSDYGVTSTIESAHIMAAIIDYLRGGTAYFDGNINAQSGTFRGVLTTPVIETVDPTSGATISAPSPNVWLGIDMYNFYSSMPLDTLITASGSWDGKSITSIRKYSDGLRIYTSVDYYNVYKNSAFSTVGSITPSGYSTWNTASNLKWSGADFVNQFIGLIRINVETAGISGTFNSKTCDKITLGGWATNHYKVNIVFADASNLEIYDTQYYTYSGSVVLPDIEGKIKIGDADTEGQYEFWSHNIPGTTDNIVTYRNIKSGKVFSIFETRAPDNTSGTGSIESTNSLHNVYGSGDFVRDTSLHNYSGYMRALDVLSNFGTDDDGDIDAFEWWAKRAIDSSAILLARLDILRKTFYIKGGRKPSGYLHGSSYAKSAIFTALNATLVGNFSSEGILLTGSLGGITVSRAYKVAGGESTGRITIYGVSSSGATSINIDSDDSTTISNVSIAW